MRITVIKKKKIFTVYVTGIFDSAGWEEILNKKQKSVKDLSDIM